MLDLNFLSVLDEKAEFLYRFSDDIWAHPETAFTEFHAAARYCAVLRSEGFAVTEGLAGILPLFPGVSAPAGPSSAFSQSLTHSPG